MDRSNRLTKIDDLIDHSPESFVTGPKSSAPKSGRGLPSQNMNGYQFHHIRNQPTAHQRSTHDRPLASYSPSIDHLLIDRDSTTFRQNPQNPKSIPPPHPDETSSGPSSKGVRADGKPSGYPCERCGRMFTRKADAVKHIRVVHDKIKNYACSICEKKFGRKDYCMVSANHIFTTDSPLPYIRTRRRPRNLTGIYFLDS